MGLKDNALIFISDMILISVKIVLRLWIFYNYFKLKINRCCVITNETTIHPKTKIMTVRKFSADPEF